MSKLYELNEKFFQKPNVYNSYIAGFIMADGCVSCRSNNTNYVLKLGINPKDVEILEYIKNKLEYTGPITYRKQRAPIDRKGLKFYEKAELSIYNYNLCQDLINIWNIIPRKTGYEKLPTLNDECFYSFILGLFDGDGSIYTIGSQLRFSIHCSNRDFLEQIKERFGFGTVAKGNSCFLWRLSTRETIAWRSLVYKNAQFSLERKRDKIFSVDKAYGDFSQEEDQIIMQNNLSSNPLNFRELSKVLHRNHHTIAKRATELGVRQKLKIQRFTQEELAFVKQNIDPNNQRESARKLSKIMRFSMPTLIWKINTLLKEDKI